MVTMAKRRILAVLAGVLLVALMGASSAFAESPWWHLTSGSRPSNLRTDVHSGLARDEVQELSVSATGGDVLLLEPVSFGEGAIKAAVFPYNAAPGVVQTALEGIYGAGNLEVSKEGAKPYVITFKGELADQHVPSINAELSGLACILHPEDVCLEGEASVTEASAGSADGQIVVSVTNLGDADAKGETTPVRIQDELPAGLRLASVEAIAGASRHIRNSGPVKCARESSRAATCTFANKLPPYAQIEVLLGVVVEVNAASGEINEVDVSGGEAPSAAIRRPITVSEVPTPFGVESYELTPEEEGGQPDTQAGSHPFQLTTRLVLNQDTGANPVSLPKDLNFKLPAGLIGNPTPFPRCTLAQFLTHVEGKGNLCSPQTVLGVSMVTYNEAKITGVLTETEPLFNIEPSVGEPARFGFVTPVGPVFIDTSVRTGEDYGVTAHVDNITEVPGFFASETTFWGVPGDPRHDSQRGFGCLEEARGEINFPCKPLEESQPPPLLALPTSCSRAPLQTSVEADSWAQEGDFKSFPVSEPMVTLDGCNRLPFSPEISVAPDGQAGSTPTGLTVGIHVPQNLVLNAKGLAEADVKDTTVTLPAGVTLNPAAADGLQACTDVAEPGRPEGEIGLNEDVKPSCPEASKVGTVEIKSPLLPNPLTGSAYLAAQSQNPFGSLVALYIVAEDPVSGTLVKLAGEVKPDPVTGQLVSTFLNTPQLPFEDFKLNFFGGDRAPLASPALCGSYTTTTSIEPWSENVPATPSSTFEINRGPNGSPCSDPPPFVPSLTAGTTSIQAGGFSPFTMTMSRPDGDQDLQAVQLKMPPGLLGLVSSVKPCEEPQADEGTCGPESLIGHTVVSVGVGGDPYSVTGGEVFLTGPYDGAPYGLSIKNPAKAGPYDLGKGACDCVLVRAKIEVDPLTSNLTVTTDPSGEHAIPHILDGIPLQIQHVNVSIDRPGFIFNPTDCEKLAVGGSLTSDQGAASSLAVPFQVTNCATLGFKPKLTVMSTGKTSRKNGTSLAIKITYPKDALGHEAWFRGAKFDFPKQLPARLTTLQKACPQRTFDSNPAACPPASRVGTATVHTQVLPGALTGVVYFVSYGDAKFPEAVIVLQGDNVTVDLHAETFISKTGVTSATLRSIPGVPFESVEVVLPSGPFSEFAAIGNLCTNHPKMSTAFTAQNGLALHQTSAVLVTDCAKHKRSKKASALHRTNKRKKR